MRITLLLFILTMACTSTAHAQDTRHDPSMPIRRITPGSTITQRRAIFCAKGYAAQVRSVSGKRKDSVFVRYHIPRDARKGYVIDHLIPLEIGGSNRITNLFPQDTASSKLKDRAESWSKHQACKLGVKVRPLQRNIAINWRAVLAQVPSSFKAE